MDGALVLGNGQEERSDALLSAEIQHLYRNKINSKCDH